MRFRLSRNDVFEELALFLEQLLDGGGGLFEVVDDLKHLFASSFGPTLKQGWNVVALFFILHLLVTRSLALFLTKVKVKIH